MYMAVTADKYELPVAIGETASELARTLGVSTNSILSSITKKQSGKCRKMKYVKVDV